MMDTRTDPQNAGIDIPSEAGVYAPNVYFTEFSARKLSNARFRGIGASPANPSITTFFDGVPQLNANSSSIDLVDVDQIEFVRGPQSALFGRNALGGLINAIFAKNFDHISWFPTFILTPLTYLGGVFYSIKLLPGWAEAMSHANPILYMVNGFRYGFLGVSDVPIGLAYAIMLGFAIALFALAVTLLNRGVGIRE